MKPLLSLALVAPLLAGCISAIPDSGAEVGSGGLTQFDIDRARREAALTGPMVRTTEGIVPPSAADVIPTSPADARPTQAIPSSDLANAGIGTQTAPVATADPERREGVQATPGNAAPVQIASTGISSEQDFDAVASERDRLADAELRAQQQAAYQVIEPEALPDERPSTGPNIVEYALNAPNRVGQEYYSRSIFSGEGRFQRNCAAYRSPDDAQRDFLARGGPERDPRGIDPDGDGFACGWDPAPFIAAVRN